MMRRFVMGSLGLCLAAAGAAGHFRAQAFAQSEPQDLEISIERASFYASQNGSTPLTDLFKTIDIVNGGATPLNWTIFPDKPWIVGDRLQGSLDAGATTTVGIGVDITKGVIGGQRGSVTIWDSDTEQLLGTVTVFLRICERACVSVDAGATGHTISPLLFGSQLDWLNSGNFLWNRPASPTCADPVLPGGQPAFGMMDLLRPLGLRMLRYPGGISADFFNWSGALGPVGMRSPQIDPYKRSLLLGLDMRECPVFGPDEFTSVASEIGAHLLTVANVGTGTAQGAANWLTYYRQRGIQAGYWEIGNEVYLSGTPVGDPNGTPYAFAGAYKSPEQYAAAFDAYARALRAVDPAVKIGAVLNPDANIWNDETLPRITERADFVSTHLLFPNRTCTAFVPNDQVYRTLMAAPVLIAFQVEQLKATLARFAAGQNKNADIGITEHGTFFWCFDFDRNRTLASALFSAMNFHVFFREPRVVMATHSNMTSPLFQSPITTSIFGTGLASAFYHVFRAYAQAAGGTLTASAVRGAPTFSSEALGLFPAQSGLPVLDTVAVRGPDEGTLRLFVVNRSLQDAVTARVAFDSFDGDIGSITMAVVNGASYTSENTLFDPNAVSTTTLPVPPAPEFDITFPAHSLVMFAVRAAQ